MALVVPTTAKQRHGHAVCTLWVQPPTSPCSTLSAYIEAISIKRCAKRHHDAESLMMHITRTMGPGELKNRYNVSYHL